MSDAAEQRLDLLVPVDWLTTAMTRVGPDVAVARAPSTVGPAGFVLNADLALTHHQDRRGPGMHSEQLAAATELRWFDRGAGVLSQTQLHRVGSSSLDGRWQAQAVRLDTQWRLSQPDQLLQWRLGDGVTDNGSGQRPIRFGGFQVGTDFSLQPT